MNYLSASEIAAIWNLSSRMVAYYCENGRIAGAVKKGKTWLIPEGAFRPADKRRVKEKRKIEIPSTMPEDINQMEKAGLNDIYRTSEVMENLGVSRELLRYYEEIGLIQPKRNRISQYREFDFYDVSRLLAIDFYKKRGFSASEIKELSMEKKASGYVTKMEAQIAKMEDSIAAMKRILNRLQETKEFYQEAIEQQGKFEIREFPIYQVQETMDSVVSFEEYKDKVLQCLDLEKEDILSNMVRTIAFDEHGYTGSQMCIVKKADYEMQAEGMFLESGRCAHIILEADSDDNSVMEEMFVKGNAWAIQNKVSFLGIAYIFIRFLTMEEDLERNFYEIWIPLKE